MCAAPSIPGLPIGIAPASSSIAANSLCRVPNREGHCRGAHLPRGACRDSSTFTPAFSKAFTTPVWPYAPRTSGRETRPSIRHDIRAELDQHLHSRDIAFSRRPHQSRLPRVASFALTSAPMRQQKLPAPFALPGPRRRHQPGFRLQKRGVWGRFCVEQQFYHRPGAFGTGKGKPAVTPYRLASFTFRTPTAPHRVGRLQDRPSTPPNAASVATVDRSGR